MPHLLATLLSDTPLIMQSVAMDDCNTNPEPSRRE
jgi:hypothetical protein